MYRLVGIVILAVCFLATAARHVDAQVAPDFNKLQQALQGNGDANQVSGGQGYQLQNMILPPAAASPSRRLPESRLEQIMSTRSGVSLRQFGYEQFGAAQSVNIPQSGAVQDDYVLGPGDEIVVSLRGQENSEYRIAVDRNGRVALPRINPILAAGRTLGDFRQDLANAVQRAYISTQAFVSVGQLRQISVTVAGEVYNPGVRLVTGLSSPIDAILISGGIKKSGSLRNIELVRDGKATNIDLYSFLSSGDHRSNILLRSGDRIVVPPLGRVVAAVGWVRRPGIYELRAGASGISVNALISLAGGLEIRSRYRLSILRVLSNGSSSMEALSGRSGTVRDSEVLFAQPSAQQTEQQAVLSGNTVLAGQYSVGKNTTVADILKSPGALGVSPYTLFAMVSRKDPRSLMRSLIPFTPVAVLRGGQNQNIQSEDIVRVLSTKEARLVSAVADAFRERRADAEEALRAPNLATDIVTGQRPDPSDGKSDLSETLKTERQDVADLSVATLGDGGVLSYPKPGQSSGDRSSGARSDQNELSNNQDHQDLDEARNYNARDMQQQDTQYARSGGGSNPGQGGSAAQTTDQSGEGHGAAALNLQDQDLAPGEVATNREAQTFGQLAKQLNVDPLVLTHFVLDNEVTINGAVQGPGSYLVGPNSTLQDLVDAAGGTAGWADESGIELTTTAVSQMTGRSHTEHKLLSLSTASLSSYGIKPHDEIRFNQVYTSTGAGNVTVQGQVRSPGSYQIESGERLSDLLLRAGGLTDVAYPYGTVYLRKSAAVVERQGYTRTADEMQNIIVAGLTRIGTEKTTPEAFTALQGFVAQLRNTKPLGRISIIADPVMLAANPSRDPLLEAGDVIYIPQRPSTVTVLGQVMQQGSFEFSPKMSVSDYIDRAGGYGQFADSSLTFLVLPDGSARPIEKSWLNLSSPDIPPGSTIVVPRDVAPIDLRQILLDVTSVLGQLAVSAASLAVISRN